MPEAFRSPNEYRRAIAALLAELIAREEHNQWMLTSHSALNGEWACTGYAEGE